MSNIIKMVAVASLAIGVSAVGFAQSTSITSTLDNMSASNNTAPSVSAMNKKGGDDKKDGGDKGGKKDDGKKGHNPPPNCVPEPVSMLALGIGSGLVMLRKRAKKA